MARQLRSEIDVVLYTRHGCHLCDQARQLLVQHGLIVKAVDIDQDPSLVDRYNECVPVVLIDGRERFRGRINQLLLRRLIAAVERESRGSL